MKILLTNDDGIQAPGIEALAQGLKGSAEVLLVAPKNEKSASSHSISLRQKLRIKEFEISGLRHFSVEGTPADCVKFALSEIPDFRPDLVISGINHGTNTGVSVYYSGTISAARESLINRIPAVAMSLCSPTFSDFSVGVDLAKKIATGYEQGSLPRGIMLNINIPPVPGNEIKGIRVTKQASSRFIEEFISHGLHEGDKIYTLAGQIEVDDADGSSDEEAIIEKYISITPLKLDLTDYDAMKPVENWLKQFKEGEKSYFAT
ncbi:MAG: 5'/3'-nucleotidase SurE [Candidatus Omnitrophica bacterium]|nr:5'/3'-nucleotidase SurE [Candidatus Omnitrophota bacterium]